MDDELAGRFHKLSSPEFVVAFEKASARWLSRDCHRSQYGYPFRVAIELALENRHRAVTLASFTCSGAEVTQGLFLDMDPREGASGFPAARFARSSISSATSCAAAPVRRARRTRCPSMRMAARRFRRRTSPKPGAHHINASDRSTWC
jgi:hypothetical protein